MVKVFVRVMGMAGLLLVLSQPARAQQAARNDGFYRRNGQMHVVRNGQLRLMAHDAHLPTGATVTKDGFLVGADGQRTELRDGQGCDLRSRPVAMRTAPDGSLTLGAPAARASNSAAAQPARSMMEEVFGRVDVGQNTVKHKKAKNRGKGKGHGKGKKHREEDD